MVELNVFLCNSDFIAFRTFLGGEMSGIGSGSFSEIVNKLPK
jgi:hypothetical protein